MWLLLFVVVSVVFLGLLTTVEKIRSKKYTKPEYRPVYYIRDSVRTQTQHALIEQESSGWVTDIFFDEDDPKDWKDYHGQDRLKEFVQLQLDVLRATEGVKFMFIAPKGSGKTTLFRIIGNKMKNLRPSRYIEVTPAMLRSKLKVDELMSSLKPRDILCIDEIHMLSRPIADTLLPAIEDGVYPFGDGMRKLPEGVSWIGATTDVGLLPTAFQDRFHLLALEPLRHEDMVGILHDMSFPISPQAADELARRSLGSPRELKRLFNVARDVAKSRGRGIISNEHLEGTFRLLDLDENGLYKHDRQVLEALVKHPKFYAPRADGTRPKRYAHSERALRALTGLDEALYRDQIEPKLLRTGFITISSGGRELTEKAFQTYFPDLNK